MIHELKTHTECFKMIYAGNKKFEVRKNDRNYQLNDELLLREFIPENYYDFGDEEYYTGRILHRRIEYILKGGQFGIEEGYVVMSLSLL